MEDSLAALRKELNNEHEENVAEIQKTAKNELISVMQEKTAEVKQIIESKKQLEIEFRQQLAAQSEAFALQKAELEVLGFLSNQRKK